MLRKKKDQGPEKDSIEELQKLREIQSLSPVDPKLELLDPNPNIHLLFQLYDKQFFWGKLMAVEVKWSPRMTQSVPWLMLRSRIIEACPYRECP